MKNRVNFRVPRPARGTVLLTATIAIAGEVRSVSLTMDEVFFETFADRFLPALGRKVAEARRMHGVQRRRVPAGRDTQRLVTAGADRHAG